ncbi:MULTISPECIES: hypothetical protein [Haloferax]|uniref:Uncharacterized protein n=1 Tax=Haloferax marinum TaxID=2666143 RepID=A0A6A8GB51_9EURY|nr:MULTISPECIES: hypothetical protein [Haloferax]KAB1198854.1 hypothetical protein Hfx1150_15525 [Haloferax sp. CBA1150]MRW97975.1 hypothetical protein [Haloferax marinum]
MAKGDVELKSPYTAPAHLISDVLDVLSDEYRVTEGRRGREKLYHEVHLTGAPEDSEYEVTNLTNAEGKTPSPTVGGEHELLLKVQKGTSEADEDAVVALLARAFSVEESHTNKHATYYSVW